MHRFFIAPECIRSNLVEFPEETARQISRVLRLKTGQQVTVLDNLGSEYLVELGEMQGKKMRGTVVQTSVAAAEPAVKLSLYLCLSQREKFELMLQKCTEIGASAFTPVISSRSLVQDGEDKAGRRRERWEGILREAAEQSGRGRIPRLHAPRSFREAVDESAQNNGLTLIPTLDLPGRVGIKQALAGLDRKAPPEIGVFIGPEGGFSDEEVELARAAGCRPVDLGRRVLRMETAAMVASTLVLSEFGEMG